MLNTTFSVIFKHLVSLHFDDIFQNSIFERKLVGTLSKKRCNIRDWKSYAVREPNIAKQLEKCIALLYYYFSYTKSVAQSWMDNATLLLLYPKFCMHLYLRFSTTFVLVLRAQNFSCPGIEGMFFIFAIQVLYKSIQPFVFVCIWDCFGGRAAADPEAEWRDSLSLVLMQSLGLCLYSSRLSHFQIHALLAKHTQKIGKLEIFFSL